MNRLAFLLCLIMMIAPISCSKPDEDNTSKLVIDLQQSAINVKQVDSADVVFRKTGTNIQAKQHCIKTSQGLAASMGSLTPGTWNADIEVYTKAINQQSNQYVSIKPVLITEQVRETRIPGPGAASGNGWLKRHVKASAGNQVVLIVAEEVYDSYFEFRSKTTEPLVFGIQREAININYRVDVETWACTNTCLNEAGRITDINHFMPFTQTILSSPWTRNEINISVLNAKSEQLVVYERIWNQ